MTGSIPKPIARNESSHIIFCRKLWWYCCWSAHVPTPANPNQTTTYWYDRWLSHKTSWKPCRRPTCTGCDGKSKQMFVFDKEIKHSTEHNRHNDDNHCLPDCYCVTKWVSTGWRLMNGTMWDEGKQTGFGWRDFRRMGRFQLKVWQLSKTQHLSCWVHQSAVSQYWKL